MPYWPIPELSDLLFFVLSFLSRFGVCPDRAIYGGYKTCMFGLFFLFNLTLSELFLLTTWMFLGLAYNKLDEYQKRRLEYWNEEGSYGLALRS